MPLFLSDLPMDVLRKLFGLVDVKFPLKLACRGRGAGGRAAPPAPPAPGPHPPASPPPTPRRRPRAPTPPET